jgi:hypothetical protein
MAPFGRPTETSLIVSPMVFADTSYPNAAKAYLVHMFEQEQYGAWQDEMGPASSAVLADYVVVNMFAQVASGQQSPKERRRRRRTARYYRLRTSLSGCSPVRVRAGCGQAQLGGAWEPLLLPRRGQLKKRERS